MLDVKCFNAASDLIPVHTTHEGMKRKINGKQLGSCKLAEKGRRDVHHQDEEEDEKKRKRRMSSACMRTWAGGQ